MSAVIEEYGRNSERKDEKKEQDMYYKAGMDCYFYATLDFDEK